MCEKCLDVAMLLRSEGRWAIDEAINILEGSLYESEDSELEGVESVRGTHNAKLSGAL
jgi:hypothetical protein